MSKLTKRAKVGCTIFAVGVDEDSVIKCAQRLYEESEREKITPKEHDSNPDCWCEPELDGGVWVHKDLH